MSTVKKQIITLFIFVLPITIHAQGDGINTMSSLDGVLLDLHYSIAPIESMAPAPTPHSLIGGGVSLISNETLKIGFHANMTLPTANYTDGFTLEADSINIEYSTWDVKISVGYLILLDAINSNVIPSFGVGYGKAQVTQVDYYNEKRKSDLEFSNLILIEPGVSFNYVVDQSFLLSLGVSYQIAVPDRLMINYSSEELNMLKFTLGLSFGMLNQQNSSRRGRRR